MIATLKDLAKLLVAKHQLKQRDAEFFVSAVVDTILEGLQADRIVKIKGFGTFKLTAVRDRESVNVNTGERIVVSGHDKISFTPDSVMRDMVNKPFAHFDTVLLADDVNFDDIQESETEAEPEMENEPEEEIKTEVDNENVAVDIPEQNALLDIVEEQTENIQEEIENIQEETDNIQEETENTVEEIIENAPEEKVEEAVSVMETIEEQKEIEIKKEEEMENIEEVKVEVKEEEKVENKVEKEVKKEERIKINGFYVPTDDDEDDADSGDSKKFFLLYAIISNILIAAIAFVLGYLCCSNNWLTFGQKTELVPEQEPVEVAEDSVAKAEIAKIDSIKKAAEGPSAAKAKEEKKETAKAETEKKEEQKAPEEKAPEQKQPQSTAKQSPAETMNGASGIPDQTPYLKNVRVRTGAYYIVGTQATITVREGQTLQSISKRYLGEGMECYVEVYNGGLTSVSAGQTIKIPKLQLKKSIKK